MPRTLTRVVAQALSLGLFLGLASGCQVVASTPERTAPTPTPEPLGELTAEYIRPTRPDAGGPAPEADRRQIEDVIHGIVDSLNRDGKGLERFYLPDRKAVFFGPPGSGEEVTRPVLWNEKRLEVTQTGVIPGDQLAASLRTCLASFREAGTSVEVVPNPDLAIRSLGDVAFATLTGANVSPSTGEASAWRWTLILERVHRRDQKRWAVVHDHLSFSSD